MPPLSREIPPPTGTPLIKGGRGDQTPLIKGGRGDQTPLIKGGRGDQTPLIKVGLIHESTLQSIFHLIIITYLELAEKVRAKHSDRKSTVSPIGYARMLRPYRTRADTGH